MKRKFKYSWEKSVRKTQFTYSSTCDKYAAWRRRIWPPLIGIPLFLSAFASNHLFPYLPFSHIYLLAIFFSYDLSFPAVTVASLFLPWVALYRFHYFSFFLCNALSLSHFSRFRCSRQLFLFLHACDEWLVPCLGLSLTRPLSFSYS